MGLLISLTRSLEHIGFFERKFRDLCLEISLCEVKHRYELEGTFPESEPVLTSLCPVALWEHFCHGLVFSNLSQKGQHPYTATPLPQAMENSTGDVTGRSPSHSTEKYWFEPMIEFLFVCFPFQKTRYLHCTYSICMERILSFKYLFCALADFLTNFTLLVRGKNCY